MLVGVNLDYADQAQAGLYVMNADGSGRHQLTHNWTDAAPHWSPDGRLIAFQRDAGPTNRVMVIHPDGTRLRTLGSTSSFVSPNPWSPDGTKLAWSGCQGLCIYDLRSSRRTHVFLGRENWWGFTWSPDSKQIAAVDKADHLAVLRTSGRVERVFSLRGQNPSWSPDGSEIAFIAGRSSAGNTLELVPVAGGRPRVLARNAVDAPSSWSPDGRRLLYTDFVRRPYSTTIHMVDLAKGTNTRVAATDQIARWSPDGSEIAYGIEPSPGAVAADVWLAQAHGSGRRELTSEFPTGLGFSALDWTAGSVPAGAPPPPPAQLLPLQATGELQLPYLYGGEIDRAGTPDSVAYRNDVFCGAPSAQTFASQLNVWMPSTGSIATTTTSCLDLEIDSYAISSTLDAWIAQADLDGNHTVGVNRPGTNEQPPIASWTSGEDAAPDIGWREDIYHLVSDGSMILFQAGGAIWRIADAASVHAVPILLPPDATDLLDVNDGQILVRTKSGFAVLDAGGSILSRITAGLTARAQIGGGLVAVDDANKLYVYSAGDGAERFDLPLAHASGLPRLLTVDDRYAVYASGTELHLLRLNDGYDRIVNLPGQAGPLQALLTSAGLFISYFHSYDPKPTRIIYVPVANLP